MNLLTIGRALWRQRILVAVGWALAVVLAIVSVATVGSGGLSYRDAQTWSATEDLLINERGFPYGRSVAPLSEDAPPVADTSGLIGLTSVYPELAVSDQVRRALRRSAPEGEPAGQDLLARGEIAAYQLTSPDGRQTLPVLRLMATSEDPEVALALVQRQSEAFQDYLATSQQLGGIPQAERVIVTPIRRATGATAGEGPSLTPAIAVFLGVLAVFVGLAVAVDNLRSRRRRPRHDGSSRRRTEPETPRPVERDDEGMPVTPAGGDWPR